MFNKTITEVGSVFQTADHMGDLTIGTLGIQARARSGRVESFDGKPALGIRVSAVLADGDSAQAGTLAGSTLTDNLGNYRIEDLPAG
jgi:hypothetical protein